ncbi:divergent polysaccharide deacteylase family protein [uncultured Tateyamaria sp.]|uniref:divergent polysaccharide deacteylase family protein n=1 Tax=uncultured Tateyamaria sp. TaxID=455651 RepID=UPI002613C9AF|nr:divergent polysaccharide deacteylase family protein [uncultured Tateyamaria sp.]
MARGFLSGLLWGGVVSVAGAAAVSIASDSPSGPDAGVQAPVAVDAPVPGTGETPQTAGDADLVIDGDAPQVDSPQADDVTAAQVAGADTPTVPQTGQADDLADPAGAGEGATVAVDTDAPVQPSVQSDAPAAPGDETELSISTDPAQPPAPDVPETPNAFAEDAPSVPDSAEPPSAEAPAPATPETSPAPQAPAVADGPAEPQPAPDRSAALPSALDPQIETGRPSIGRPATSLINRDATPDSPDTATPGDEGPAITDAPPMVAYAAPFENPEDKPLMSIVLIDNGADLTGGTVGLAALQSFPYPLTFAVNASLPDAAARAAEYRGQGFEVAVLLDLPEGATAGDTEVTLSAAIDAVPEAVAVMEGTGTGLQETRDASDQVSAALLDSGHGLILQSKGLNTAQKLAVRDGVPAGLIFRDFDSAGQTPTVIRRFLDQAAFRAGQEGGVIMVGRVRPDTISALLLWGLQDRAERVALAPVSAVLTRLAEEAQ